MGKLLIVAALSLSGSIYSPWNGGTSYELHTMKPLLLDMCCGRGGWAAGFIKENWKVIGVDLMDFRSVYPGEFVQANLLTWEDWRKLRPLLAVASTPCDEFSRWGMPWTRARNPPRPSLALYDRAAYIARALGIPLIQENVRAAQMFLGRSVMNCGPFHLWGDVPALVPVFQGKKKESFGSKQKAERAVIPEALARHIARCFYPHHRASPTQSKLPISQTRA